MITIFIQLSAAIKAYIHPVFKEETGFTKVRAQRLAKILSPLNLSITVKFIESEKFVESEKYDDLMDDLTIDVTRNRAATSSPTP